MSNTNSDKNNNANSNNNYSIIFFLYLKKKINIFWYWFWSKGEIYRETKNPVEKFQLSIRVTAQCRNFAASRLRKKSKFAFFTITFFSLGLIFIPLMQISNIKLAIPMNILNIISIFFAVTILVYSIIVGTSSYEKRYIKLDECGEKLRALNRELDKDKQKTDNIEKYEEKYQNILKISENHEEVDYDKAQLEMKRDFKITGFPWLIRKLNIWINEIISYFIPLSLLILECLFIAEMFGIIQFFSKYLTNN